jgi:hypothetical protein
MLMPAMSAAIDAVVVNSREIATTNAMRGVVLVSTSEGGNEAAATSPHAERAR